VSAVPELITARLRLRDWTDADREPFAALNADPEVMRHFPAALTREESDAFVDGITTTLHRKGWGLWAVEVRETGAFIGYVGLNVPGFDAVFTPCVEVGWRLRREVWGQGYAPEAARAALTFGFDDLGLDEIVSFTTVDNAKSRRVMEKLGMTHDPADDFEHPRLAEGHPMRRHALYRLTATAFRAATGGDPSCRP
jgi:RimJ/RimL family protein N-acetyltransferase